MDNNDKKFIVLMTLVMLSIFILLMVAIICAARPPKAGIVIDKRYEPARTYIDIETHFTTNSDGDLTTISVPVMKYDDEDWLIMIEGENSKGKLTTNTIEVSYDIYKNLMVGSMYGVEQ
jgi:hypothetical protein